MTFAERTLLYQIRYYARFRKEYYSFLIAGGNIQRLGLISPEAPLSLAAGAPGSQFVAPSIQVAVGQNPGYAPGAAQFDAPATGYLPLLLRVGLLINLRENVAAFQGFFEQFRELQSGGEIPDLQVRQIQQNLFNAQTSAITAEQLVRDSMDQFKLQLGLPPVLPIEIDDSAIRSPAEQLDRFQKLTDELKSARQVARTLVDPKLAKKVRGELERIMMASGVISKTQYKELLPQAWKPFKEMSDEALIAKLSSLSKIRRDLRDLGIKKDKDGGALSAEEVATLRSTEFQLFVGRFERSVRIYEREPFIKDGKLDDKAQKDLFEDLLEDFMSVFVEPRNERLQDVRKMWAPLPKLCVDGVDLLQSTLADALWAAGRHSLAHRLDLMNGRAQLTDAWRQIRVAANSLMGYVDLGYGGEFLTPADAAKPLAFNGLGRHQIRIRAEAPLVRIAERNNYRAVLINWQRMRRNLMAFEDTILLTVRTEIRQLRALARTYEIQKQLVELSYLVLDNAVESIYQPKPPGSTAGDIVALTNQLIQAQTQKFQAQNQLLTIWINYQTFRILLYRDLELMPLDSRGVWIDDIAESECCSEARPESGQPSGTESAQPSGNLPNPAPVR